MVTLGLDPHSASHTVVPDMFWMIYADISVLMFPESFSDLPFITGQCSE
jgi:hypothetical protein